MTLSLQLRTLMSVIAEDGMMPPGMGGAPGRMNMGDYAMTQGMHGANIHLLLN